LDAANAVRYRRAVPDTTPPPPPIVPDASPFPQPTERKSRGCLKWGLLGCAGLSVLVIIGLIVLGAKSKQILGSVFARQGTDVIARCTPEVTAEDKAAFETVLKEFTERAKNGGVKIATISTVTTKLGEALRDNSVTPEEIRDLTSAMRAP
jgi:hypothetical protein